MDVPSVAQSIVHKTQSGDQGALPEELHRAVLAVAYGGGPIPFHSQLFSWIGVTV